MFMSDWDALLGSASSPGVSERTSVLPRAGRLPDRFSVYCRSGAPARQRRRDRSLSRYQQSNHTWISRWISLWITLWINWVGNAAPSGGARTWPN